MIISKHFGTERYEQDKIDIERKEAKDARIREYGE